MERRRQRAVISRRCCVLGATLFSVCRGPTAVVVSAFGPRPSSSLGRTLAAAAAATAGNAKTPVRRGRRPRALSPSEALSATSRRTSPFVGEAPTSNMKGWRDLGPEEERALCEQITENRRVQDLQLELERTELRPVTVHEWAVAAGHPSAHQLMAALQEGRRAERTMLLCHQGLVRSVAFRYQKISRSLSVDDLCQEGNVGLLQAVERFDPTKGARFSSYAVFRIKASILRAVANKDRLVRVPVHAQDAAMQILAASHALQQETGSAPTDAQLALALSMPQESVSLYRRSALPARVVDLDNPTLPESVVAQGRINGEAWPSQLAQGKVFRRDMARVMQACLSPAEERVLRLRFGLEGPGRGDEGTGALTFKEIGRTMELSAEGIRKMVFRSIAKLQESDEANGLLLAYAGLV
ncbi:unnamed protein product [Laminaria digitata]